MDIYDTMIRSSSKILLINIVSANLYYVRLNIPSETEKNLWNFIEKLVTIVTKKVFKNFKNA